MRILTMICCVLAIVALYGCGGSSQLTEDAQLQNFLDSAVVRVRGAGNEPNVVSSAAAKDNNFFSSDTFAGDGIITGESLNESIDVDCMFSIPTVVDAEGDPIDGDNDGVVDVAYDGALISVVADLSDCGVPPAPDKPSFGDLRNCCIYDALALAPGTPMTIDAEDSCGIDIDCVVDESLADLDVTSLSFEFDLEQYMETTMRDDSGAYVTAIEERSTNTTWGQPTNKDLIDMSAMTVVRSMCDGSGTTFEADDSVDLNWPNDGDFGLSDSQSVDKAWLADGIGLVSYDPGGVSACAIFLTNMPVEIPLLPLVSSQSIEEYLEILGVGMICNSRSATDCDTEYLYDFEVGG